MALSNIEMDSLIQKYNLKPQSKKANNESRGSDYLNSLKAKQDISIEKLENEEQGKQGFLSRAGSALKERFGGIKESLGRGVEGEQSPVETGVQVVGETIGGALDVGFEVAKSVLDIIDFTDKGEELLGKAGTAFLNTETGKLAIEAINKGAEAYKEFAEKNPRAAANIESLGNIASVVPITKVGQVGGKIVKETAEEVGKKVAGEVAERIPKIGLKKIESKIVPKATSKEVRRALSEGRVVRTGKARRILGVGDKIKAEQSVKDAAEIVKRRINNAVRLSDQEIATQAKQQISTISKELSPKLKQVKLQEEAKENIINSWADLKTRQLDEAVLLSEGQLTKAQAQFEKALLDVVEADNVDDLWKVVQKYDDSVKDSIKNATPQSSELNSELKDIWLDNRRILRDSLDEASLGITDNVVEQSFKDMRGLFTARNNIIANAGFKKTSNLFRRLLAGGAFGAAGGGAFGIFID